MVLRGNVPLPVFQCLRLKLRVRRARFPETTWSSRLRLPDRHNGSLSQRSDAGHFCSNDSTQIKEEKLPVRTGQIPYLPAWECAPAARGSSPCVWCGVLGGRGQGQLRSAGCRRSLKTELTVRESASEQRSDGCTACTETPGTPNC